MLTVVILIFDILSLVANGVYGQTQSGVTSTGQTYLCLPNGTPCPTASNTIDPRIVTPTGASPTGTCPTGFFPCYGQATQCGQVFLTPNTTANGPAPFGAYPWQAYLRNTTSAFAGSGVLVDSFHVLTAAHKVYLNQANPTAVTVQMGVWNPSNLVNVQSSTVSKIDIHPNFIASTLKNDIAVLTLTQPIVLGIYSNINTACLAATGSATSYVGQTCAVSGWGQTAFTTNDAPTNPMKQVRVSIVNYTTCRTSYAMGNLLGNNVDLYLDPNGEICAGGASMLDACTQDGGSPLICYDTTGRGSIAGLVIWGKNCGQAGVYGVYVNVPYYYTWIQGILNQAVVVG